MFVPRNLHQAFLSYHAHRNWTDRLADNKKPNTSGHNYRVWGKKNLGGLRPEGENFKNLLSERFLVLQGRRIHSCLAAVDLQYDTIDFSLRSHKGNCVFQVLMVLDKWVIRLNQGGVDSFV